MNWSRRYPWPLDRDPDAIPPNIREGVIVLSPMLCRAHMSDWIEQRPDYYPDYMCSGLIWRVITGQSFRLRAVPTTEPIVNQDTHTVVEWYRLWMNPNHPPSVGVWAQDHGWDQPVLTPRRQTLIRNPADMKELEDA